MELSTGERSGDGHSECIVEVHRNNVDSCAFAERTNWICEALIATRNEIRKKNLQNTVFVGCFTKSHFESSEATDRRYGFFTAKHLRGMRPHVTIGELSGRLLRFRIFKFLKRSGKMRRKVPRTSHNHDSPSSSSRQRYDDDGNAKGVGFDAISPDLVFDILSRLPVKSLVKFQCVSKLWSSIIRSRDFINSFLTRYSARPYPLSVIVGVHNTYIFSSVQPKNLGEDSFSVTSPCLIANDFDDMVSLRGLICFKKFRKNFCETVICNPSTRQVIAIPNCKPRFCKDGSSHITALTFFGYDVVDDQYKVLCTMASVQNGNLFSEHFVFVLGAGNSWRRIQGTVSHIPSCTIREVCINGVLYYGAVTDRSNLNRLVIVSFDVRSEELNLITVPSKFCNVGKKVLTNYEGKVALGNYFHQHFVFIVLEDKETEEWTNMHLCKLLCWKGIAFNYFHGTSHTGELIFAPREFLSKSFDIFYYDLKRKSFRKVEVQGLPTHNRLRDAFFRFLSFSDHFESIMFLDDFSSAGTSQITFREFQQ